MTDTPCLNERSPTKKSKSIVTFMSSCLALCRGNNQSKDYNSSGYDPISPVFSCTKFDRFLLEYDDERSGGFEPLKSVPEDRTVVLG